MTQKFTTLKEVKEKREEFDKQFNGKVPNYLVEYLDNCEKTILNATKFRDIYINTPEEDRIQYVRDRNKEIIGDNEYELVKVSEPVHSDLEYHYNEPFTAKTRVEEEKELSQDEINALIEICKDDLYLFAIRYFPHYLKRPSSRLHKFLYNTLGREINKNKKKGSRWAIAAPRGSAKCEEKTNKINKLDGTIINIGDIQVGDKILSFNKNLKLEEDTVVAKWDTGTKLVRTITLRSGRKTSITEDHRLFNLDGEIELKNIKIGDRIATPRKIDCITKQNTMSLDEATFLAYILAEGGLSNKSDCRFTNFDKIVIDNFEKVCKNLGFELIKTKVKGQFRVKNALSYLRKYKLMGHKSTSKFIPDEVFKQNNEFLKVFLSSFIDTDGWISKNNISAGITLANEKMVDQLFTIFLRLGFLPVKQGKPNDFAGAWAVTINGIEQLKKLSKIGLKLKQDKLLNTIYLFKYAIPNPNLDLIDTSWKKYSNITPHFLRKNYSIRIDNNYSTSRKKVKKVADICNNQFLRNLADSDIYWDEVVDISEPYLTETCDIETEKNHNFISNNIFSHNCMRDDALVTMVSGFHKELRSIVIGDKVISYSGEKFEEDVVKAVHKGKRYIHDIVLESGRVIGVSKEHRLYSRIGLQEVKDFVIGDKIAVANKVEEGFKVSWEKILYISQRYKHKIVDIEVEKNHNFIANGILSHNSTLVSSIFPLWCAVYNKKKFIIIISNTAGQAEDFLSDIKRELEYNLKLKQDFPHAVGKGKVWRASEVILNNDVKILSLGTGNQIRGRRFGIYRPSLVLLDDLEDSEMVKSQTQRDFIRNDWFNKDLLFAGGEKDAPTDFFVVGTILGKDSLLNALLDPKQYPDWSGRRFPAVEAFSTSELWKEWERIYKDQFNLNRKEDALKFFEAHKDEMLEGSKVLWPEGDPYYELMTYKISDPSGFLSEKQCAPIDYTKLLVTEEQLTFYNFNTNPDVKEALSHARYFGAIDPSLGKKTTSGDFFCICTLARDVKTGIVFVIDFELKRASVDEQIDAILRKHLHYHYKAFGVESNAFQYVVADTLRKKSRKEGVYIPVTEIYHYNDKKMRFEGIVPFILDGTIVFDKNKYEANSQYNSAVTQLCTFTGENDAHDDAVDACVDAFELAKAPRYKLITKTTRNEE